MTEKLIMTVWIPAYNNEAYTRITLESVLKQDYRPLNVILLDDASPNSLSNLAQWFDQAKDSEINFRYHRNEANLSADTYYVIPDLITTDWCIQLHHDDWFVDPGFISSCVRLIENDSELVVVYANAKTEFSNLKMLADLDEEWRTLKGPDFLRYMLRNGHTAWSAISYKWSELKQFGYPGPPFLIDRATKLATKLDMDEGFSGFYLLSQLGNVAVSGRVVSVRGEPKTSFSRSSEWKTSAHSLFYIYMGCYLKDFKLRYSSEVRRIAKISTYYYGINLSEGFHLPSILNYYQKSLFSHVTLQYFLALLFRSFGFSSLAIRVASKLNLKTTIEYEHVFLLFVFFLAFPLLLLKMSLVLTIRALSVLLPTRLKVVLKSFLFSGKSLVKTLILSLRVEI